MRTSKILLIAVALAASFLFVPVVVPAQTKPLNWIKLPTRTVLLACQDAHAEEPRVRAVGRTICESLVSAYVDGFMRGTIYGGGTALIHDPKAMQTLEGVDDLKRRLDALDPHKACTKDVSDLNKVVAQWSVRVYSSEDLDEVLATPYTTSLYDVISKDFCTYK